MLGITGANGVTTPRTKERGEDEELGGRPLPPDRARVYRALAARINFVSQGRADIQYATKEACREMSAPSEEAWERLKGVNKAPNGLPKGGKPLQVAKVA